MSPFVAAALTGSFIKCDKLTLNASKLGDEITHLLRFNRTYQIKTHHLLLRFSLHFFLHCNRVNTV